MESKLKRVLFQCAHTIILGHQQNNFLWHICAGFILLLFPCCQIYIKIIKSPMKCTGVLICIRFHCRQSILTSQINSFIFEVSILIFYTVEIAILTSQIFFFWIFAKSVFNFNCIKYKNTHFVNEWINLRSQYTLTTVRFKTCLSRLCRS